MFKSLFRAKIHTDQETEQYKKWSPITGTPMRYATKEYVQHAVKWNFSHIVECFKWRDSWCFESNTCLLLSLCERGIACLSENKGECETNNKTSGIFSVGLRSGNRSSHIIRWIYPLSKQSWRALSRVQDAPSSMNKRFSPTTAGKMWTKGSRISGRYR